MSIKPKTNYIILAVFVALTSLAEVYSFSILTNHKLTIDFIVIATLIPAIIYLFDYGRDKIIENSSPRANNSFWILLCILSILSIISLIISYFFSDVWSSLLIALMIALGILYNTGLKSFTRRLIGFKDYYVALCWSLILVLYFQYYSISFNTTFFFLLLIIVTRDIVNVSFYDLKDRIEDKARCLKTLAAAWSDHKISVFLHAINALSVIFLFSGLLYKALPKISFILVIPFILSSYFIAQSIRLKKYDTPLLDLEYFIWAIVLVIIKLAWTSI